MVSDFVPRESHEQITFVTRVKYLYPHLAGSIMAIPNGGYRNKAEAARMKREGVMAGAPDLFVALVRRDKPGLFIEMKRVKGGSVSKAQKAVHATLRKEGYQVEVCRGADAAWEVFEEYVREPDE